MQWYPSTSSGAIIQLTGQSPDSSSLEERCEDESNEEKVTGETLKAGYKRWLVFLRDETEARRFIRIWHKRPFPLWNFHTSLENGEALPLVHTEFIW